MDSIFLLSPEARTRFFRSAARALGWTYICLWSPLYHPSSNYFASKDGWHQEDDGSRPSSSTSGSSSRMLFDAYRTSLCNIEGSCVPGLAYKSSLPYVELGDLGLMNLASMQAQRQFYQEAGIKTAVFLGCTRGEIEFGTTTSSDANMQINVQNVFTEDFIQQSQLGEECMQQTQVGEPRPASSSSSLRSLSVGSPDSSLLLTKGSASVMPEPTPEQVFVLPHQVTMQAYSRYRNVPLPSPASDDAAITRAMLAVISSTSSSSSPKLLESSKPDRAYRSPASHSSVGAFKPYSSSAFAPISDTIDPSLHGQKMIKMVINLLRKMNMMRFEARMQDARPSSNQLHHMISERKRREKLKESFDALRMLLPQGSKKDKASVLANTRNYLSSLKAQISELEERNRLLELKLQPQDENKESGGSNERVKVQISRTSESASESQQINLIIMVREECNMIDMVLNVLECLKKMGNTTLISVEASTRLPQTNDFMKVTLTLQVKTSDCDEEWFKEAVFEAVNCVLARSLLDIDVLHHRLGHQI